MIAHVMERNGLDPTVIIGGEVNDIGGNASLGQGEYLVAEADESDGSFLKLKPHIAVITNIEDDHMDYYKNMDNMLEAYCKFIDNIGSTGFAVLGIDNENVRSIATKIKRNYYTYGIENNADYMPRNIRIEGLNTFFDLFFRGKFLSSIELHVPGVHNVYNATAAIAVGHRIGQEIEGISKALKTFHGVQRRFQIISKKDDITVVDDYAHHPTEINATLKAAKSCNPRKIYAIFQPHRYTRTQILVKKFGEAFSYADEIIITKIYSAGEKPIPGVSSELICDALKKSGKNVTYIENKEDIPDFLIKRLKPGDFAITIGAGDINNTAHLLAEALRRIAL
jgi:UDP-N-acetylmuramate--alanine ligase